MEEVDVLVQIVWDYMLTHHNLVQADAILVFGSHDIRVAQWAAKIYLDGYAPFIIFSGKEGHGKDISGFNGVSEARRFADEAVKLGVPESALLLEDNSTNTAENVLYSSKLLVDRGVKPTKLIVVHKPYMERRTFATLMAQWPQPQPTFIMTSQSISYTEYINSTLYPKSSEINIMVGDLQRIMEYPKLGYQVSQDVPPIVKTAYKKLISLGYNKNLIS